MLVRQRSEEDDVKSAYAWPGGLVTGFRLLRSPGEIPAMAAALAVGVGLTVAAYGLIHAVLTRPLPYREPGRLVQVWEVDPDRPGRRLLQDREVEVLAEAPSPFEGIASHVLLERDLVPEPGAAPVELAGAHVSVNLFQVLGVEAATGRTFRAEDGGLTNVPPIVVSRRLVRSGLVSGRLGGAVEFEGASYRLIGTMPETFWFPDRQTEFWAPVLAAPREQAGTGSRATLSSTIARLGAGVGPGAAQAQTNVRLSRPGDRPGRVRYRVESHASLLTAPMRPALAALQAGSGLVLLLVGLNVGWLYAARGRRLQPTLASLRALGATTGQVLVTHLAAAACVVAIAAPCAVLIAWGLLRFSLTLESGVLSRTAAPAVTGHVAAVAFALTVLVGAASCLPGAVAAARARGALHERARAAPRGRWERPLMVLQAGLVFALSAQAVFVGLVLQSLVRTNVGFTKTDFLVVKMQPRGAGVFDANLQLARYKGLLDRLGRRGVRAAAASTFPFTRSDDRITFEPREPRGRVRTMVRLRTVTPSYFQVTGTPVTRGRLLADGDAGSHLVVVNDAFLAAVLPGGAELGRRVGQEHGWTVVGVAPPVRQHDVHEEMQAEAYVLFDDALERWPTLAPLSMRSMYVLAETTRGVPATLDVVRAAVADQMPEFAIRSASPVTDLIGNHVGRQRLVAAGAVAFAVVSLLLAAIGLQAMVGQDLAPRGREIGVRMALGATVRRIALDSARPVGVVYAAGVCLGTALLLCGLSAMRAVIVPPPGGRYPPWWAIAAASAAVLLAAFAAACWRPIRTATRVDPADALRAD